MTLTMSSLCCLNIRRVFCPSRNLLSKLRQTRRQISHQFQNKLFLNYDSNYLPSFPFRHFYCKYSFKNQSLLSSKLCKRHFSLSTLFKRSISDSSDSDSSDSNSDSSDSDSSDSESSDSDDQTNEVLDDEDHKAFSHQFYHLIPGMGHNVLIILPKVKWGKKRNYQTTPELQLAEATALVETLPNWKVLQKVIMPCDNPDKKLIFGSGNIEKLKDMASDPNVTAVFINRNTLGGFQRASLQECFQKSVYDRFTIVLQIFKDHARSKEAKLQVALAEIPYLRINLRNIHEQGYNRDSRTMSQIGGSGESYLERRKRLLFDRELKLKKLIERLKSKRRLIRQNRLKKVLPTVAVVGYTNSGKTSLIKALTGDERLQPRPQLFATLDVTAHRSFLACQQLVIYLDTVGFITDIPTTLIGAFAATLDDIALADLIIHVWDVSHPDLAWQRQTVKATLENLNLPHRLLGTLLEVGNKVDLLESPVKQEGEFLISATNNIGLLDLQTAIEERLLQNTGMIFTSVRVPNGGEAMRWLNQWTAVQEVEVDSQDSNFLILSIVCTHATKNKFTHHFGLQMENRKPKLLKTN